MRLQRWPGVVERYRGFLPVDPATDVVTLFEGNTPLVPAPRLSERVGANVYLKLEGLNPTGSFKDRGMTLAVTKAKESGSEIVVCASTGNTSASAAAYAAKAGLRSVVLIPSGCIAKGKLAQALVYGADIVPIEGNFDHALSLVRELGETGVLTVVNSINQYRIEGQKTAAFEIVDQLGDAPDYNFMPVGNAGNITAYWRGYTQYLEAGVSSKLPKMMGFQAAGAAPLVKGEPVPDPQTIASAIRIGNPASRDGAINARDASGGIIGAVEDDEIIEAYILLAREESVFCEPASAASVAGMLKTSIVPDSTVVCVLTGNGLKDPDTAISLVKVPDAVGAELHIVAKAIGVDI
jgi:threonine synthase